MFLPPPKVFFGETTKRNYNLYYDGTNYKICAFIGGA
jgi:hypothetical protein